MLFTLNRCQTGAPLAGYVTKAEERIGIKEASTC